MRCSEGITHRPYIPPNHAEDAEKPYICRLSVEETRVSLEWFDRYAPELPHFLRYRERGSEEEHSLALTAETVTVEGLAVNREYELYIMSSSGKCSNTRYIRTCKLPEGAVVVNYLHPQDMQYAFSGHFLCSPSLVRLPDRRLIAGMDVFDRNMGQNLTLLFSSEDDGASWHYLCDVYPFYWSALFVWRGKLYILGLTTEYGNLQIACSEDGGAHFSRPTTLLYGANNFCSNGGVHRAPMQVVAANGRLYTSCEYGSWNSGSHIPGVLSVAEDDDLLVSENWTCSAFLSYAGRWKEETVTQGNTIEGNIVRLPDGHLYNILRWKREEALALRIDENDPDAAPRYDRVIPMPVTTSMFRIYPYRKGYLLITNHKPEGAVTEAGHPYRNILSIYYSRDFEKWIFLRDIVNAGNESDHFVGFQYPCAILEGDTICVAVRSAFGNAPSFHDSNYSLFFRIQLTEEEIQKCQQ